MAAFAFLIFAQAFAAASGDPAPEIVPPFFTVNPSWRLPSRRLPPGQRTGQQRFLIGLAVIAAFVPPRGRESLCDCATTSITPFPDKKGPFTATTAAKMIPSILPRAPHEVGSAASLAASVAPVK